MAVEAMDREIHQAQLILPWAGPQWGSRNRGTCTWWLRLGYWYSSPLRHPTIWEGGCRQNSTLLRLRGRSRYCSSSTFLTLLMFRKVFACCFRVMLVGAPRLKSLCCFLIPLELIFVRRTSALRLRLLKKRRPTIPVWNNFTTVFRIFWTWFLFWSYDPA